MRRSQKIATLTSKRRPAKAPSRLAACFVFGALIFPAVVRAQSDNLPVAAGDDAAYQAAVRTQMQSLATETVGEFYRQMGVRPPATIEVETDAVFDYGSGEPWIKELTLAVNLGPDQPAGSVREVRTRLSKALVASGYVLSPTPGERRPVARLRVLAEPTHVDTSSAELQQILILLTLTALPIFGAVLVFSLYRRLRRNMRLASSIDAQSTAVTVYRQAVPLPAGPQEPVIGPLDPLGPTFSARPSLTVQAAPALEEISTSTTSISPAEAPAPRADTLAPAAEAATDTAIPAASGAYRQQVVTPELAAVLDRWQGAKSPLENQDGQGGLGEGSWDIRFLIDAPRHLLRAFFAHLSYQSALELLAGLDARWRDSVMDRLQLNAAVKRQLETDISRLGSK